MCWLMHSWGKWKATAQANLRLGEKIVGAYHIQERTCGDCGFTQRHEQRLWVEGKPPVAWRSEFEQAFGHDWSKL